MAVPKRRTGKSRRDRRRAHHRLTAPSLTTCRNCRSVVVPHRVCPSCGQYNGRAVVLVKST